MKLPSLSLFGKKEKTQYFLALLLRDEKVTAVIFEESLGKIRVVGEHEEEFSDSIESATLEEWLEVLDKAISQAEGALPENVETQKTIFGVKEDWVEDKQIKKEYLSRLKRVSDELSLTPIGFLVIAEAIAHFLGKEEGVPVSAVLIEVGKQKIAVSLLRAGRVIETKRTRVEDSIAKTTDRILFHFTSYEVLPSRIILFNGRNEDDLSQELIGHSWSKSLPFLHVPQITTLPSGFDARAILFGAASEMGFEVLGDIEIKKENVPAPFVEPIEEPVEEETFQPMRDATENEAKTIEDAILEEKQSNNFGFVTNTDVSKGIKKGTKKLPAENVEEIEPPLQQHVPLPTAKPAAIAFLKDLRPLLAQGISLIPFKRLSTIKDTIFDIPQTPNLRRGKIIFIPPIIVCVLIGLALLYVFALKATVTLYVKPHIVEKNQAVVFSTSNATDFEKNTIGAEPLTISQDGSLATPATGTKEVGEKAKGTVTILSSLTREQTIPEGTTVTSSNGLVFVLDNAVKIASSSGLSDIKTTSGPVVAKEIGKEYNLPSGTKFSVGNFDRSSVEGKNDNAFSGGSKKEVTAVAKADIDKLISELPKSLEKKAKEEMMKKISEDKEILPTIPDVTLSKREFDKDIGDEAKSVKLNATVTYETILYKKSDLNTFTKNLIKQDSADADANFKQEDISIEVKNVKQKDTDEITATVYTKATLIPTFDNQKISNTIHGKSFEDAEQFLLKLPQVVDTEFDLWPGFSFLPKMLPRRAQNISFEIIRNE